MDNVRRGMKAKTIKAVIGKKIKSWVESIEDEKVRELVKKNTIVTGVLLVCSLVRR